MKQSNIWFHFNSWEKWCSEWLTDKCTKTTHYFNIHVSIIMDNWDLPTLASILDHNRIENNAHYVRGMLNLIYSSFGICICITAPGFLSIQTSFFWVLCLGTVLSRIFQKGLFIMTWVRAIYSLFKENMEGGGIEELRFLKVLLWNSFYNKIIWTLYKCSEFSSDADFNF